MADLRDERGNTIYLTNEQGKPAQLMDECGNAMHLTGVATTVPKLKESSYTGPHPITAPVTTAHTPYHAQPISVSHNHPLQQLHTNKNGQRAHETKSKPCAANEPSAATVTRPGPGPGPVVHEPHEKKSLLKKIKDKLP